jgi:hypothetical protein
MSEKKNRFKKIKPLKPKTIGVSEDSYANFSFIAGYTSGGAPYGLTWDEDNPNLDDQNKSTENGLHKTQTK